MLTSHYNYACMYIACSQADVDFHRYYETDELLKQFKEKMECELYPPRFRINVKVKDRLFFSKQHTLKFVVTGGKRDFQKNVTIDATFNGMYHSCTVTI